MINEGRTFICSHCLEESPYFSLFFDGDGNECCASCYDKLPEDQKIEDIGIETEECDQCGQLVISGTCEGYDGLSVCPDCYQMLEEIDEALSMLRQAKNILEKHGLYAVDYIS